MSVNNEVVICGQKFDLSIIDWIAGEGSKRLVKFKEEDKYLVYDHFKQGVIKWFNTEDQALNYMQEMK